MLARARRWLARLWSTTTATPCIPSCGPSSEARAREHPPLVTHYYDALGGDPSLPCDPPNSGTHDSVDLRPAGRGDPLALLRRAQREGARILDL